jgi:predicted metal-dependent enzyme (double-stranded beta helix superfamily)
MPTRDYKLNEFVRDLRAVTARAKAEATVIELVKPLMARLARSRSWIHRAVYECNADQGFGVSVLHEEPGHRLWLVAVSWLPGRGAPPHNHGTWAVIAGVEGAEKNVLWRRRGGRLERQGVETIGPRDVTAFLGNAIHSVVNDGERTSLSIHIYGSNLNFVERSQFDPQTGAEKPFKVQVHSDREKPCRAKPHSPPRS